MSETSIFDDPTLAIVDFNDPTQNVTSVDIPFCDVFLAEDLLRPSAFSDSNRLERTNDLAIRFGASNEMLTLLEGSNDESEDYLYGLLASSLIVAVFFLIWSIVICVLRCTGNRRVGFLCGRFVRPDPPPPENENAPNDSHNGDCDALNDDELKKFKSSEEFFEFCAKQDRRIFRCRIVVAVCALCTVICAILFCVYGNKYISSSLDSTENGFRLMQRTVGYSITLFDRLLEREAETSAANQQALEELNGLCPLWREKLCEEITPVVRCNVSGIPFLEDGLEQVIHVVYERKAWLFGEISQVREDLQTLYDDLDELLNEGINLEWAFWFSFAFSLLVAIQCCVILWLLYHAHKGNVKKLFKFYRRHVIFPVFVVCVLIAYVFACAFIIAAIGASDFCIDSPDRVVNYLLNERTSSDSSLIFGLAKYYVNRCEKQLFPTRIVNTVNSVIDVLNDLQSLTKQRENLSTASWKEECGTDLTVVDVFLDALERTMCDIFKALQDINVLAWCRNWNPIYTSFMYDAVCRDAQEGLAWVASTMLCILLFGFVILFLRAAIFDVESEDEFAVGARLFARTCNRMFCRKSSSNEEVVDQLSKKRPVKTEEKDEQLEGAPEVHLT